MFKEGTREGTSGSFVPLMDRLPASAWWSHTTGPWVVMGVSLCYASMAGKGLGAETPTSTQPSRGKGWRQPVLRTLDARKEGRSQRPPAVLYSQKQG